MTIYTVTSTDDLEREPLSRLVAGSYTSRGRAVDECVKYIMERLGLRFDLAYSLAHDENHPEASEFFSERRKDGATVIRKGCVCKLRDHLRDVIGGEGCYVAYDGVNSWHFDVDENGLEGSLWHTVTWGSSDCEDPAFTTPRPETFLSRRTAVSTFRDYVRDMLSRRGLRGEALAQETDRAAGALDADGRVQVDLDDGCCVSCVLYRDDAKSVKE